MAKKINYDFLKCARYMPALSNSKEKDNFDIKKSEAAKWLVSQPEVMQKVFDLARYHGLIEYNPGKKTWQGVDYDGN